MFTLPLFRIILKTQDNNNGIKNMPTPIYNIPIGEGGNPYNISNKAPHMEPPSFSPLFAGGSPPVRIPSYIWVLAAGIRGSEPSLKYERFFYLANSVS